ncbi:GyrI-like domain-containing protein [Dolichospermum sp. ST_sed9]|nr:GyrI-like domain-containing protein [Dolichospermum sp. ST_sed9]
MFSPKTINASASIKINCTKGYLFVSMTDTKEWPKWVSWTKADPDIKYTTGKLEISQGASFSYTGPKFGKGSVDLIESFKDSIVTAILNNNHLPENVNIIFQIIPERKNVVYLNAKARTSSPIPFLKRAYYYNSNDKVKELLINDLSSLKTYLEGIINTQFGIETTIFKKKIYFGIRAIIFNSNIPKFYAESYPKIYAKLDSLNIDFTGPPVGMIFDWEGSSNNVYIMAALPIDENIKAPLDFEVIEIPDIPCLKLEHFGMYNTLKKAHSKLDYLMSSSEFVLEQPIIEEYVTSPSQEPDTSKWLTNIYYLLNNQGSYSKGVEKKKTMEEMIQEEEEARRQRIRKFNK